MKGRKTGVLLNLVTERAEFVAKVGTVLGIIGLVLSIFLYANLKTDIEELLPDTARSVRDLLQVDSRLYSMENVVVLAFSNDPVESKRFIDDFAEKLNQLPKTLVSRVEYKIDKEIQFFKDRQALFMDLPDLEKIHDYVSKRIDYEHMKRRKHRPRGFPSHPPELNYGDLSGKYEQNLSAYDHFPGGYYATPDEKIRAVVVYMPGKGLELGEKMKAAITKIVSELNPKSYAPDLEIKYTGNVQNMLEESAALVEDLLLSTVVVMVLVMLAMLMFYDSLWATAMLLLSLFMGVFWTFGISYILVGYLNANTAFLASIVIGNGINFGIIFLARYMEERRGGKNNEEAISIAIKNTMTATATAALAAGLSYGSLMTTGFRGFSQFGVIGLIGMVLCWISAYTLLPAYLTLVDRKIGNRWIPSKPPKARAMRILGRFIKRNPRTLVLLSILAVLGSVYAGMNYKQEIIETDLSKLRDKRSMQHGSGSLYHYIDDIFGHSVSPMVILPQTRDDAKKIAALFRQEKDNEGKNSVITSIQTLTDFLPDNQRKKADVIIQIQDMLTPDLLKSIPERDQKLARILTNPMAAMPFTEKDLPPMVQVRFREVNGSIGNIVLVDKVIERGGDSSDALSRFVDTGRKIADHVEPGTPVAGGLPVTYDMYQAIVNDGPRATFYAFCAVLLLVILLFRNVKLISLALFALILGVTWLAGLILGLGLKINFLNFIALPITFGIGVDYGVNIFQRYRETGARNILKVIQNTGGAVMLCSLTTIIGYSSLLIAGNQAFVSFGRIAVLGELTCVTAAVVALPAFLISFSDLPKRFMRFRKRTAH